MARFTEEQLKSFTKPASATEEEKLDKAKNAIKTAINNDSKLSQKSIEIFGQGSYANDTNVKNNSDIDINVMYYGCYYHSDIPENTKEEDFNLGTTPCFYSYKEFKNDVEQALINYFGRNKVNRKNKCISVNTYDIDVDVVPTWKYKRFDSKYDIIEGVTLFTDNTNQQIINYPKQHIENGKNKNSYTHKRFKWLTRIYKRIRYKMIDDGVRINNNITSFLLECLVWNVPNHIFNNWNTWTERLQESIKYIYNEIKNDKCSDWREVSELLDLFDSSRKWSKQDVLDYLEQMLDYLEY